MASCATRMLGMQKSWMTSLDMTSMMHGLVDRKMHFVDGGEVVGGVGIVAVEAELVGGADELDVAMAELAVGAGVLEVPEELLADGAEMGDIRAGGKLVDAVGPDGRGKGHEEDDFEHKDAAFELGGKMAGRADVVGLGVLACAESARGCRRKTSPSRRRG